MARIVPELRSTTLTRVDLYLEPPPSPPPPVVWPSGALEPQKNVSKCTIIDFQAILKCFFTDIVDFLRIFGKQAGFRAPPLIEGCGLRFEGAGRIWEGTRTVGETRDEGDP